MVQGDGRLRRLDQREHGLALDPFDYFYAGYPNRSGRFDYVLNEGRTSKVISAFFKASGAGTATITVRTPLVTAEVSECWDDVACLTFVRDPSSVTNLCGPNTSCGLASACPSVP